jgi:transcriptional regulator with XRE-family HTH domain
VTRPASAVPDEDDEVRIGARLRAVRTARRMTVEDVATAAEVTKGFLSRLERDRANASVAVLVRICKVLELPVGALFEPAPAGQVLRRADYPPIGFGGHGLREHLLTPRGEQRLAAILSDIEPGGGGGAEPYALPADVEFCFVLSGTLELTFPQTGAPILLGPGDTFTFDPGELHTFSAGARGAQVLWVISPGLLGPPRGSAGP